MQSFLSVIDNISKWSGRITAFLVVPATIVVVYGVVVRYVFNAPTIWGLELTIYLCAATYLVGGAYVLLLNAHVRVDVLYTRYSPRLKAIIDLFIMAPIFFISLSLLFWAGADWTIHGMIGKVTSGSVWEPIIWPVRLLIPLGCLLLLLQGVARVIRDFDLVRTGGHHEH